MRLGQAAMEALRAEITGCLKPGDELVVACPVALKGTSVIAKNKKDKLAERFSAGFIQNCVSLWDAYGAGSIVWKIAQEADASALYLCDHSSADFSSPIIKSEVESPSQIIPSSPIMVTESR